MKRQTGCDGVMIGRGAIGNPWIFRQILEMENGLSVHQPELHERKKVIMEHFRLLSLTLDDIRAVKTMRGLLLWYTKGLPNSSRFRESINRIKDRKTLISLLDHYFATLENKKT
jgi:tRNA-dihydrouridine synthase B